MQQNNTATEIKNNMTTTNTKEQALAKYLGIELNQIKQSYDENNFEAEGCEYLVLTDSEADDKARENILESVWAFNHSFLSAHSEAIAEMDEEVFKKIQEMCESANKTILRLIDDVDHFVNDAILSDGRGHFMSSYDGEENEQGEFFIYRTN